MQASVTEGPTCGMEGQAEYTPTFCSEGCLEIFEGDPDEYATGHPMAIEGHDHYRPFQQNRHDTAVHLVAPTTGASHSYRSGTGGRIYWTRR